VLSSRYGHDIIGNSPLYYGYIGSFGLRYSNFILSKADLIISLGNRLNFPITSESYKNIPYQARIVRFESDREEFSRDIPNAINYQIELEKVLPALASFDGQYGKHEQWIDICREIKEKLWDCDVNDVIISVDALLSSANTDYSAIINDVGDNEFWISRACAHSICGVKSLYSKSFASLGSALPKSIGAYYSTRRPTVCFTGDQGFQMNLQELQAIAHDQLPVLIVVMNNYASGMIRDKEKKSYGTYLHSTLDSGYSMPDLLKIAEAYGILYYDSFKLNNEDLKNIAHSISEPIILNLRIDPELGLAPYLPIGRATQDMEPELDGQLYNYLDKL
jgi:acetolactate synthase-1/2/3 large subunit